MLDQSNARLLSVAPSSSGEAFDGPQQRGASIWEGSADAYLRIKRDRQQAGALTDRVVDRRLVVSTTDPPVEWRSGLWVEFEFRDGQEWAKVRLVETYEVDDPDIPSEVQTTRLTLEAG